MAWGIGNTPSEALKKCRSEAIRGTRRWSLYRITDDTIVRGMTYEYPKGGAPVCLAREVSGKEIQNIRRI
jgi:hypothetical protein